MTLMAALLNHAMWRGRRPPSDEVLTDLGHVSRPVVVALLRVYLEVATLHVLVDGLLGRHIIVERHGCFNVVAATIVGSALVEGHAGHGLQNAAAQVVPVLGGAGRARKADRGPRLLVQGNI